MRRLMLVVALVIALLGPGLISAPADAASPRVSRLSQTAGPLTPVRITLTGARLSSVRAVRFGRWAGTKLVHHGSTSVVITTPRVRQPAKVTVAVKVGSRWISGPVYRFLAKPVLSSLSKVSGPPTGGSRITLTGGSFVPGPVVTFGSTTAHVVTATSSQVTVVVPSGLDGATPVKVSTRGGSSSTRTYTYVDPAPGSSSSYVTQPGTYTAQPSDIGWVTGGPDPDDLDNTAYNSWTVSMVQGATLPTVGSGFFLAPGSTVFPSGLTGTVSSLASQTDGTTRVTIDPTDLSSTLSTANVSYSGPEPTSARTARTTTTGEVDQDISGSASYSNLGASAFKCEDKLGQEVSFSGSLALTFTRLHPELYFEALSDASFGAYVTGTVVVTGKVTAEEAIDCTLDPLWADAHRKIIPLGDTGATLSFGPTAELKLSIAGTVEVSQTTQFMYGLSKYFNDPIVWYHNAKSTSPSVSVNSELSLTASAGVSIQFGLLDRVGAETKAQLFASAGLSAPFASTAPNYCVSASWGFSIGIDAFLDLFVARWESPSTTFKINFADYKKCNSPPGAAPGSGDPVITSTVLPDATVGTAYDDTLTTQDNRNGNWSIASGSFPSGLSLSSVGELSGTPVDASVGTSQVLVQFTDTSNRTVQTLVKITVRPSAGLGGGDMQATLTWAGAADLDLHAQEPDGNEIYFGNPGPSAGGGELDHDSNANCAFVDPSPTENIHWPHDQAESGTYYIWVQTYATCNDNLDWHLVVRIQGQVVLDTTGTDTSTAYEINFNPSAPGNVRVQKVPAASLVAGEPRSAK